MILDSDSGSKGVPGACWVPVGQGLRLQGPRGSRDGPRESQGGKGQAYRVPGVKARGMPTGSQGSRQGDCLQGPRGSIGRPTVFPGAIRLV